jgi:transcriptional regulator PpsR
MSPKTIGQPDITLRLDSDGVIQEVTVSDVLAGENVATWVGRPWAETVADVGAAKIRRLVEDARTSRVAGFRQVSQRFPSGLEVLFEYTTVWLGGKGGVIAIGRSLQVVADLQTRLIQAQQAMERDYWKLREVETRYRLLFNASNEAVMLLRASDLRIIEANPAAVSALGLQSPASGRPEGWPFLDVVALEDHDRQQETLLRVRAQGKAPGMLLHFGQTREPWVVRASLVRAENGPLFLLQLGGVGAVPVVDTAMGDATVEMLIDRGPDSFCVLDQDGAVLRANRAFLDLVQATSEGSVVGRRLGRWLARPGADLTVLLASVQRHGVVRLFSTTIHSELGSDTDVEISAVGNADRNPTRIGVLIRDVGRRLAPAPAVSHQRLGAVLGSLTDQVGRSTLRALVRETVGVVERHYIEAALELTGGNRTAAAELLGLSRQSLYSKLDRYDIEGDSRLPAAESD